MSSPLHNQVEQAYAELERQRDALADIRRDLAAAQTTVTSKNRALAVTVDSRGAVTGIKFLTGGYRSMAAAELAQLLVDTIASARSHAMESTVERFRALLPPGMPLLDMINGAVDFDGMVRSALRAANDPWPGDAPTGAPAENAPTAERR
jgi:hypothetical protein